MLKEVIKGIFKESDVHTYLNARGFKTNHKKHENENGYDIIALKNGESFLIEFKRLDKRDKSQYRYTGDVKGDILIVSTPKGVSFLVVKDGMSLTKAARFMEAI